MEADVVMRNVVVNTGGTGVVAEVDMGDGGVLGKEKEVVMGVLEESMEGWDLKGGTVKVHNNEVTDGTRRRVTVSANRNRVVVEEVS